eukprot:TRINITY_DN12064_c0_g1_i1.p1 TRINITY_DN12064_c0_g1~~TRINITY_DN12064_c0_g1_i1.p1  ORF type:complete len:390 (-),score=15.97 TRINITY_DN12064_c0_g1_i1:8-1126(-)
MATPETLSHNTNLVFDTLRSESTSALEALCKTFDLRPNASSIANLRGTVEWALVTRVLDQEFVRYKLLTGIRNTEQVCAKLSLPLMLHNALVEHILKFDSLLSAAFACVLDCQSHSDLALLAFVRPDCRPMPSRAQLVLTLMLLWDANIPLSTKRTWLTGLDATEHEKELSKWFVKTSSLKRGLSPEAINATPDTSPLKRIASFHSSPGVAEALESRERPTSEPSFGGTDSFLSLTPDAETKSAARRKAKRVYSNVKPFVGNLYNMLTSSGDVSPCGWTADGLRVRLEDRARIESVLPLFFGHASYRSLTKMLNANGFHKVHTRDIRTGVEYEHSFFQRGRLDLLPFVGTGRRPRSPTPHQPNAYAIDQDNA